MTEKVETICMGCEDKSCTFAPIRVQRRPIGPHDVLIDMKYCGVCHTDLHIAAGHMTGISGAVQYPCIPGHELAGVCVATGEAVTKIKVGDKVGVGCMVDSCGECKHCKAGDEMFCKKQVQTYQGQDWSGRAAMGDPKMKTAGGYTSKMVVNEKFAIKIDESYPLEYAGPVMCAGITLYEPLKKYGATAGTKVGIVGLGGLGIMGVKLAKALGSEVTAISRSKAKKDLALAAGATNYIASGDPAELSAAAESLDLVINTIPMLHDTSVYTKLVKPTGHHVLLGLHAGMIAAVMLSQMGVRNKVKVSFIGGIPNTQEVMDLCAKAGIKPDIEVHSVQELNRIFEKLDGSNDAGARYVLDIQGTLSDKTFEEEKPAPTHLKAAKHGDIKMTDVMKELFKQLIGWA